jgi:hypothetical protein
MNATVTLTGDFAFSERDITPGTPGRPFAGEKRPVEPPAGVATEGVLLCLHPNCTPLVKRECVWWARIEEFVA